MATVLVRAGNTSDLAALVAVNAEIQALHFANRPDQFKPVDSVAIERWFVELFQNPAASVWVAQLDERVVGYAVVIRCSRPEGPYCPARAWWDLDQVGVLAEQRRTGVCRALVERVLQAASAENVAALELSSWNFNETAQDAFRSLGFVPKVTRFELSVKSSTT